MVLITTYKDKFLQGIVKLWNTSFSTKRNFLIITPHKLRAYCINRPDFNPNELFIALEENEVVGMSHVGYSAHPENGLIHILVVQPNMRRKGVGKQLLEYCHLHLSKAETIIIGAMDHTSYYNCSKSSLMPLWGSSEGIGIETKDSGTRTFLEKREYRQLTRSVSLYANLDKTLISNTEIDHIHWVPNRWIMVGGSLQDKTRDFIPPPTPCNSLTYIQNGIIMGKIVTYPMSELQETHAAIIDFWVQPSYRRKGIGTILLDALLNHLIEKGFLSVELVTNPTRAPRAFQMYQHRGFKIDTEWCLYQKIQEN